MDIDKVYEFSAGKNDWNTIEVGLHDGRIVVRDEIGMLEFDDDDVDQLVNGIDQARRRLREEQRIPTKANAEDRDDEPDEVEDTMAEEPEDEEADADEAEDEPQSTGLGPQFPGSDDSF